MNEETRTIEEIRESTRKNIEEAKRKARSAMFFSIGAAIINIINIVIIILRHAG